MPANKKYQAIVIGGSAGSFQLVSDILGALPKDFKLPIILCLHRLRNVREGFVEALMLKSNLNVIEPYDKQKIKPGFVYLAPANYHMLIELTHTVSLSTDELVNYSRPSIDLTLQTAAFAYKKKLLGIILSGANRDGAFGLKAIKENGGFTICQNPAEATVATMPESAINIGAAEIVLEMKDIIEFLKEINLSN